MKRTFVSRVLGVLAALIALVIMSLPSDASAQEIQLTGPLAGAPACRSCRLYRQGRGEIAIGYAPTILDEYERSNFVAGRLQYNIFDWLGIGVFGGYNVVNIDTDLTDKIDATAPRNSRTAANIVPRGTKFGEQTGKLQWMATPQLTFSPFRGKLAIFQKLFVDTDLYLHGGLAVIGLKERGECGVGQCTQAKSFGLVNRTAFAPSFGLGLTLYTSGLVSINMEYRAFPMSWNRGGFDSRGGQPDGNFPDNKIDSEDQTFKFNQMVFLGVGFHLPSTPKLSE